jgi:hypothetical protein
LIKFQSILKIARKGSNGGQCQDDPNRCQYPHGVFLLDAAPPIALGHSDPPVPKPMIIRLAQLGKTAVIFYNEGAGSRDPGYTAGRLPFRHYSTSSRIRT